MITGASRGLGLAFTRAALERGDRVAATMRDPEALSRLESEHEGSLLVIRQDVREAARAAEVAREAGENLGPIDVLVNNAGYGLLGAIEELTEGEILAQVETNFLGALWTTRAVLPEMRERGEGEIVQISTTGAVGTMPFFGLYNASKWALEGFSEALAAEVSQFGIGMTIAELGGFGTDWAGSSMVFAENHPAYDEKRKEVFGQERLPWDLDFKDPDAGDPEDAARALLEHLDHAPSDRPLRLLVGNDAAAQVAAALAMRRDDYARDAGFEWPA